MPRCVLVAGCGYVGAALASRLVSGGDRVYGLSRNVSALPEGVLPISADLTAASVVAGAIPSDVERIVYCAAASSRTEEAYQAIYRRGLENVLEVASGRGIDRVAFTSSTAVYAQDDGGWVDETSPTEPAGFAGRALLAAEEALASAPMTTVVLRLAGIYGPARTWLVRRVHSGEARVRPEGAGPQYGNRIHRDDCAGALAHLIALEGADAIYVGVDDAPAPLSDVHRFVAGLLGVTPVSGDVGAGRGGNKRCTNRRLKQSGYALLVPSYREGYPPIVDGWLAERS